MRFGPPETDLQPYIAAGIALPCNLCVHDVSEHEYMYTLNGRDVYRCRKPGCRCGQKSEVRGMALASSATEADVEAAMQALALGGGHVIGPERFPR